MTLHKPELSIPSPMWNAQVRTLARQEDVWSNVCVNNDMHCRMETSKHLPWQNTCSRLAMKWTSANGSDIDQHQHTTTRCMLETWHIQHNKAALNREWGTLPEMHTALLDWWNFSNTNTTPCMQKLHYSSPLHWFCKLFTFYSLFYWFCNYIHSQGAIHTPHHHCSPYHLLSPHLI